MRTSMKLLELLSFLRTDPKAKAEVLEKHDGRTIASAERRGFTREYSAARGVFVMLTERGEAFLVLELDEAEGYNLERDPWAP